jgi:hypothetical protein
VPDVGDLRKTILREAHDSAYSIHPGSTKMYQDLKQRYWRYGMKRDVAAHVALCDTCHRTPAGYDSIWVIVDRLTKVANFILVKTTHSGARLAELYICLGLFVCMVYLRG